MGRTGILRLVPYFSFHGNHHLFGYQSREVNEIFHSYVRDPVKKGNFLNSLKTEDNFIALRVHS